MGNAARTIQSAIRARLLDSMTLPVRAFSELPPEVEDPAQFHFNRADWKIIPRDIQQHLVRRITDSNDPAGLNLRAMIRALAESIKRGGLPLYLLRRKKLRYGTLNSSYIYRPTLNRVKDQKFTKSLPDESNSGDDLAGYYFTQIFHSIGNILNMNLAQTENVFLDGSRVDASDIAKLESNYIVSELRIDVCQWIREFLGKPVADNFYLSVKQYNGSWKSYSSNMDKHGFTYPAFRFTAGGVRYQVCGMFLTPVVYCGGGPALIKADAAILVYKNKSTSNMSVAMEDQSMNGMYGATQSSDAYDTWTLPSPLRPSKKRKKQGELPTRTFLRATSAAKTT